MIPYPFYYLDEKQLKRDLKKYAKIENKIRKMSVKISNLTDKIEKCSNVPSGFTNIPLLNVINCECCIKDMKILEELEFREIFFDGYIDDIMKKWQKFQLSFHDIAGIEILKIKGRSYPTGSYWVEGE